MVPYPGPNVHILFRHEKGNSHITFQSDSFKFSKWTGDSVDSSITVQPVSQKSLTLLSQITFSKMKQLLNRSSRMNLIRYSRNLEVISDNLRAETLQLDVLPKASIVSPTTSVVFWAISEMPVVQSLILSLTSDMVPAISSIKHFSSMTSSFA